MAGARTELGNLGTYGPEHEHLPFVVFGDSTVTIKNYRDASYPVDAEPIIRWRDETFDPSELTNMWVYFSYFAKVNGVAHTEVGFEFADGRVAVASFEVRTLVGEHYGIFKGMGRNFEMSLRWVSERDTLTHRFRAFRKGRYRTHMFEGDVTHGAMVNLFDAFLRRTNELHDEPEWYNTINNTCSTSMINTVNDALPGQLRRTPRTFLPGMLPKLWARKGVIKYSGDFNEAFEEARINERALAIGDVPDFSARLHQR